MIGFKDADFGGSVYLPQTVAAVSEPETYVMLLVGLGLLGFMVRRSKESLV